MCIQAIQAVWDYSNHKTAKRLLMIALADHARPEDFRAWPGNDVLAQYVNCTERYIQKMLAQMAVSVEKAKEMQDRGEPLPELIFIPGGDGPRDTNTYFINLPGAKWGRLHIGENGELFLDEKRVNHSSVRVNHSSVRVNHSSKKGEPGITRSVSNQYDPLEIHHDPLRTPAQSEQNGTNEGTPTPPYTPPSPADQSGKDDDTDLQARKEGVSAFLAATSHRKRPRQ